MRLPRRSEPATIPAVAANDLSDGELISRIARRRPRGVRVALPALRAAGVRARAAAARRPRPRRGRRAGDVRRGLALRPQLPARARARRALALRRRAQRDRRPRPRPRASRRPRCRTTASPGRRPGRARRGGLDRRGACTARSRSCRRTSASVIELAYWSGLSQSEVAEFLEHPARHRQDAHARGARPAGRVAQGGAADEQTARTSTSWSAETTSRRRAASGCGGVHDLLLAAGPPPELPPHLLQEPRPPTAVVPQRHRPAAPPHRRAARHRRGARAGAFGGGYIVGHGDQAPFASDFAVPDARHRRRLAAPSAATPARQARRGRQLADRIDVAEPARAARRAGYYELYLTKDGQPVASCGTFTSRARRTTIRLNAPYDLSQFDGGGSSTREEPGSDTARSIVLTAA